MYIHKRRKKEEREREIKERNMSVGIHVCIHKNEDFFFAKLKDKRIFFSKTIDFVKKLLRTKMS